MRRTPEQFDGENGCVSPQLYPAVRLHGPEPRGIRAVLIRAFRFLSRRLERRERVVVAGQEALGPPN